jgi:hypothetical protein
MNKYVSIFQGYGLLVVDKKWQQSTAQRDIDVSVGATVHTFADRSYIACILNEVVILKCSSRVTMHSRGFLREYIGLAIAKVAC